jgi:hypothetical protein
MNTVKKTNIHGSILGFVHMYKSTDCTSNIYIYIYIERERERERESSMMYELYQTVIID